MHPISFVRLGIENSKLFMYFFTHNLFLTMYPMVVMQPFQSQLFLYFVCPCPIRYFLVLNHGGYITC